MSKAKKSKEPTRTAEQEVTRAVPPKRTGRRASFIPPDKPEPLSELTKGPKQGRLPAMDDPAIEELESAAEAYVEVRDRRMALTESEVELKDKLLTMMDANGKVVYHRDGIEIRVVPKDRTVKVKVKKDED